MVWIQSIIEISSLDKYIAPFQTLIRIRISDIRIIFWERSFRRFVYYIFYRIIISHIFGIITNASYFNITFNVKFFFLLEIVKLYFFGLSALSQMTPFVTSLFERYFMICEKTCFWARNQTRRLAKETTLFAIPSRPLPSSLTFS